MVVRKARLLGYIIIGTIFTNSGFAQKQKVKSPKIKFDEVEFDFGEIRQGKVITHIFRFRNIGNDTLVIERTRAP